MNVESKCCYSNPSNLEIVRMSIMQWPTGLQDLFVQLAQFFRANETTISTEHVSKCLEQLPAIESSALDRLLNLLYQTRPVYLQD